MGHWGSESEMFCLKSTDLVDDLNLESRSEAGVVHLPLGTTAFY